VLLVLAAILGVPVAAIAYFFLKLAALGQHFFYKSLISDLGFSHEPLWWPLPLLIIGGLGVALTIRYLPGTAAEKPAEGLKMAGLPRGMKILTWQGSPVRSRSSGSPGTGDPCRGERGRARRFGRWASSPCFSVAAPATCPGALRARIGLCRSPTRSPVVVNS